jgi:hypothetical protein
MNAIARDIIKEFGLEELPEAEKQDVIDQMSDVVMQAVLVRGLAALTETQQDALDAALEKNPNDFDVILDFFAANIPNFDGLVQEEVARIKEQAKAVRGK